MMRAMSPEAVIYARISLVVPLVVLGLLFYAIARRYRGLPVPGWTTWSGAFLVGLSLSPALIFFVNNPVWVIGSILPIGLGGWLLARTGRYRLAGLSILGMSLPGFVWWARFLVEDVLDPLPLYDEVLWAWWLPSVVGVLVGAGLFVLGDRPRSTSVIKRPPNTARDPMTLGNELQRAISFGLYPVPSIVSELVAFAATLAVVSLATAIGLPWPVVLLGGALLFMLVATELWYVAFPREARRAWAAFSYVGHVEVERFRRATGNGVPNTEQKMRAWLAANEERPETRAVHAELLAVTGRIDEARAMAQRIEVATPAEEHERNALLDYIGWIDGADPDHEASFRAADMIGAPGSRERIFARGLASIGLARTLAAEGGDWMTPLTDFQREIGEQGWAWFREDTHRQRMTVTFLVGLLVSSLFVIPGLFLQPLI
jgi:hypothetical protein